MLILGVLNITLQCCIGNKNIILKARLFCTKFFIYIFKVDERLKMFDVFIYFLAFWGRGHS